MLLGLLAAGSAQAKGRPSVAPERLPVVFVHGNSGSAQQWESQFQRFASNGWSQDLLFAYEYDTSVPTNDVAITDLTPFIDAVLAKTGASQVLLAAHSRGTMVSMSWLADPANAAKVAKYASLDGRSAGALPGGVPTIAVWGEWNSLPEPTRGGNGGAIVGAVNVYDRQQGHTETASSARTFAAVHEFLTGQAPETTDVVPEPPGQVTVAGRAVLFPQNAGFAGASLDVWRIDASTGQRRGAQPVATYEIDETGAWGPLKVNARHHYEFALERPGGTVHHFYSSPFVRDDHFVRLNSGPEGQGLEVYTTRDPRHSTFAITRAREMWGDHGEGSDRMTVDLLGDAVPALNVLTPATAPRTGPPTARGTGEVNALFLYDAGVDQQTDLSKGDLPPFGFLTFLNAADVFLPASPDASGTIRIAVDHRDGSNAEVLNVPNWPSPTDRISVILRDWTQQDETFPYREGAGGRAK
jgi:pimeloyl-ACP methyl ester carboxylesterase